MNRTRFKKEIIAEYMPPKDVASKKVVIIMNGAPSRPGAEEVSQYFTEKGYWAFQPRYRGSWESEGVFLGESPHLDVLDVIEGIQEGFVDAWSSAFIKIDEPEILLVGVSFGGPAVLMSSHHPLVRKVIALSPVVDWIDPHSFQAFQKMYSFTRLAFGEAYRFAQDAKEKLSSGVFYNPATSEQLIAPEKIFIHHAKDDDVIPIFQVKEFVDKIGIKHFFDETGGHSNSKSLLMPSIEQKVAQFLA